jgi:hypothetical protein
MNHETIGRRFLPILGWMSVVSGYIILFGGSFACLVSSIVYFVGGATVIGIAVLFGGIPSAIVEGIASIAVGDMMIRFEDVLLLLSTYKACPDPNLEEEREKPTPAPAKEVPAKEEETPAKEAKLEKKGPEGSSGLPSAAPEREIPPNLPLDATMLKKGLAVIYHKHKAVIYYVPGGTDSVFIAFSDGQVERVRIEDLTTA